MRPRFLIALLSLLALMLPAGAAPVAKLPPIFDVPSLDAWFTGQVQQASRVGLSVVIVKDGQVVLAKGYGKRSIAGLKPVETNTLFAIGSISKQFTCASVLLLAQEGKLSVNDRVSKYYPHLTRANDITLLDLMNHVSGYPDYYPLDFVDRRMQKTIEPDELLKQYAGGKLDFEPGSRYSYSNTGFILLGRVVEKVSGQPLGRFLTERIFQPLGMADTAYEPVASDTRLARGYTTFALSGPEPIAPEATGWIGAAGGIYSTPLDLAKWDLALTGGKVLKPEFFALMTTPRKLNDGHLTDYGCGLGVRQQGGRQILSHSGAVSGFNASNIVIPSTRSAVIIMANLDGGLGNLPSQVLPLLLATPVNVPKVAGASALETVKTLFLQHQSGKVDRQQFAAEFNAYLTDEMIAGAAKRLKPYGAPVRIEILDAHERGGMEVTTGQLTFRSGSLRTLMYRQPDGKVEQFFISKE